MNHRKYFRMATEGMTPEQVEEYRLEQRRRSCRESAARLRARKRADPEWAAAQREANRASKERLKAAREADPGLDARLREKERLRGARRREEARRDPAKRAKRQALSRAGHARVRAARERERQADPEGFAQREKERGRAFRQRYARGIKERSARYTAQYRVFSNAKRRARYAWRRGRLTEEEFRAEVARVNDLMRRYRELRGRQPETADEWLAREEALIRNSGRHAEYERRRNQQNAKR